MLDRRSRFEDIYRFEEIYNAYSGLILGYAARRTTGAEDAADVVAETFLVAWRRMDDIPAGEDARPWLYGVARKVLANQRRGTARRDRLNDRLRIEVAAPANHALTSGEHDIDAEAIAAAFGGLGEDDRELLTLVAWDGLTRQDIAAVLGCSTATVRVRLHRARRRLAERLDASGVKRPGSAGHQSSREAPALSDPEES